MHVIQVHHSMFISVNVIQVVSRLSGLMKAGLYHTTTCTSKLRVDKFEYKQLRDITSLTEKVKSAYLGSSYSVAVDIFIY
jgi:hypothetical protein